VRTAHGWWEVRRQNGDVISRYASEFQAADAGRAAAETSESDLLIHQLDGQERLETFDPDTRHMRPAPESAPRPQPGRPPRERRRLVLLVEDMVDARELYAEYLAYAGFSIVTAINGHEGIRLARLLRPDVILMDVRLPGMDGIEATADIKADPELAHIPIIALTADSSEEVSTRATNAGCIAVITKPVLPDELARRITALLASQQPRRSSGQSA
jgi:CheY-like chemotaxis protein